jgi:transcriptional regulator of acetoin/glycerol metabolism
VAARQGRALRFSPDALRALLDYSWPGNVREMENALEYAVAVCRGQTLMIEDVPAEVLSSATELPKSAMSAKSSPTPETTSADRTAQLEKTLEAHHWRRLDAARALGISRATLWRRMREAGLSAR